ncbi:FAD-binding oxidoreductase [Paractinoplanes brasiliensis]|uniref:Glycolate oxidase FAD binding subunit n=1 Tax=Paractinoplanes brasiliensis TaxID=52695 RepID=A0A4R6JS26_9ACTN|nr:FAD-binding oxidoreductase [Actinoplanes brasiliensis]TDO39269.1 glycolate oxidase FAD binding subunit [Actinoplanes brasiliensis]GID30028.1 glycolate oxidase [Actinoplanes brasiliensis]
MLSALTDICGPDYARAARSIDAVGGRRAGHVAVPATAPAVADILRLVADLGLSSLPRGSGSKIDWGTPRPGVDVLIDTGRLNGMWNHDVERGTAEVATGTPVRALQAALALQGQRLPVDPPSRTATVGGMLAVNESGPLRHRFGTPAEYVRSVTYVDSLGRPGESDGEDGRPGLAEIDGVITAATLRLEPLPQARRWVGIAVPTPSQLGKLVGAAGEFEPSAIETDLPAGGQGGTLAVLFEGAEAAAVERAERLAATWGSGAVVTPIAPPWWGVYPFRRDDVALRLSVSAADLHAVLYALGDVVGGPVPVRGSAGLGTVHAVLPGTLSPPRLAGILDSVRHVLLARNGRAAIVAAPPELAHEVEMANRTEFF